MKTKKLVTIPSKVSILLCVIGSISITFLSFILQPNDMSAVFQSLKGTPTIFIYNLLPVLILVFFIYFLFDHIWVSLFIVGPLVTLLSIINHYKIIFREDPLVPMDFFLITEAYSSLHDFELLFDFKYLILILLMLVFGLLLILFTKRRKLGHLTRILGLFCCIILSFFSYNTIYRSQELYASLPVQGQPFLATDGFNSKGFLYSFLYNLRSNTMAQPQGYNPKEILSISKAYTKEVTLQSQSPHIIMIMGEAFTDISNNSHLIFSEEENPLRFFNALKRENLLNGSIIVPCFGGGTANTEFDVLTGCCANAISETSSSAYRLIRNNFDALPRALAAVDYTTLAIHPGYSWFYNRKNVYNYFGFTHSIFEDTFNKPDMKGHFISEAATIDRVIDEFEAHLETTDSKPLFEFCVTIQNHMPYVSNKYDVDNPPAFDTDLDLSTTAEGLLTNYFIGIKDADQSLEKLVTYLRTLEEPVILVYFGDHLPSLGQDYLAYKEIGYDLGGEGTLDTSLNIFKTPFFIWANASAKQKVQTNDWILPANATISAPYLGALVLELIGYKDVTPFISFVNNLRRELPILPKNAFAAKSGATPELPKEIIYELDLYKKWQYFKLMDEVVP